MKFLLSSSGCAKLADHLHKVSNLSAFSSLSLEKQKETVVGLL